MQYSYAANFQLADDLVSKLLSDKTGNEKFKAKIRDFELSVKDTIGKNNNGNHGSACQCQDVFFFFIVTMVVSLLTRSCAHNEGLDLRSFLIMPVQRVPRYKVLIEELLKLTPNHFPDKELLKQAFKSIKETATFIDETIRFKEGLTSVCLLVESIFSCVCIRCAACQILPTLHPDQKAVRQIQTSSRLACTTWACSRNVRYPRFLPSSSSTHVTPSSVNYLLTFYFVFALVPTGGGLWKRCRRG